MVDTTNVTLAVRKSFKVRLVVVIWFPDSGKTAYSKRSEAKDVCSAEVVNVWGDPASVVELEEVIACFVVASNEYSEIRGDPCTTVIFMKVCHASVFMRH